MKRWEQVLQDQLALEPKLAAFFSALKNAALEYEELWEKRKLT